MSRANALKPVEPRPSEFLGLGILSFTPANRRHRAMTIEDFSISSVGSKPSSSKDNGDNEPQTTDWETVSWLFSEILQNISAKEKDNLAAVLTKSEQLVQLLADHPALKHEIVIENVLSRILFMLYDAKPQLRSAAYRILRHTLAGRDTVAQLVQQKLLVNITVSLSTQTPLVEKEEALKLIRAIISIPDCASLLSVGVIKALVVLIEHESDESSPASADPRLKSSYVGPSVSPSSFFCKMCIETLCELLLLYPELVFQAGGMRLLINLIVSAPSEIASVCVLTFLTLIDHPDARFLLRGGTDLDSLFSMFGLFEDNDSVATSHETAKLHKRAMDMAFLLSVLLKSWTGLLYFCHDSFSGFKLLLMHLKKKNTKLRTIILDLLMDVLRLETLPWLETSRLGSIMKRFSTFMSTSHSGGTHIAFKYLDIDPRSREANIVAHHQGLLLKVMLNCNASELLLEIINSEKDEECCAKATTLLTHIFEMSVEYLPSQFYQDYLLGRSSESISLESIVKIKSAMYAHIPKLALEKKLRIKGSVREMTQAYKYNLSDAALKVLISNVKSLHLKEFTEWDWTSLSQLFQGPMRNPRRFAEIQEKYPKLLKTFFSFLRPFKYRFGQVPIVPSEKFSGLKNPKIVILVASQLFESLLSFDEGAQFLTANKFMPQLAEILAQVDPASGITSHDPILSERRLKSTLSIGYVKIIGVLSGSARGIRIMEQWQLLQLINDIVENSAIDESNNHLIFNLLNNLNYDLESPLRLVLLKALSLSNLRVKLFVLTQVLPALMWKPETETFVVDLLVGLLYDENDDVVLQTITLLFEFFNHKDNYIKLDTFVEAQPCVNTLGRSAHGSQLLLSFCKTSKGFKYLHTNGYIDLKFKESVRQLRTFEYLDNVESTLRHLFYPYLDVGEPKCELRHFFYYLLSTEEGMSYFKHHQQLLDNILQKIRHLVVKTGIIEGETAMKPMKSPVVSSMTLFSEFTIGSEEGREYTDTFEDESHPLKRTEKDEASMDVKRESLADDRDYLLKQLKQNMWILGEIASAEHGFQLLDPSYSIFISDKHIAEVIVSIFRTASHWQFRGLAFYILGMMAATEEGVEILDELNWVSVWSSATGSAGPVSLAYPLSLHENVFTEDKRAAARDGVLGFEHLGRYLRDVDEDMVVEGPSETAEKVLNLINYLSSILGRVERKAKEELRRIKDENPMLFCNASFFLKVVNLLERGCFKYRHRVYIFGLFDCLSILAELVRRRRKNSIKKH